MKKYAVTAPWIAILLVFCFSSCAPSITLWNQANEKFSQAASLEMKNRLASRIGITNGAELPENVMPSMEKIYIAPPPAPGVKAEDLYQMADANINKALSVPAPLKKEDKLANAMTLKALTAWKTGKAEEARISAANALQEFKTQQQPSPRDHALARAVPGLVALDLAYDTLQPFIQKLKNLAETAPNMPEPESRQIMEQGKALYQEYVTEAGINSISGALEALQAAIAVSPDNKEVGLYLQLSQLAGLKNQYDLWSQMDNFAKRSGQKLRDPALRDWLNKEKENYTKTKNAAMKNLEGMLEGGTGHAAYRFWDGIL